MEAKKTSRSNLENKRIIFREIGFVIALSMVFCAFEAKFYQEEVKETIIPVNTSDAPEILPIFTAQQVSRPLPKITMKPLNEILIVDNLSDLESDLDIIDNENNNVKGSLSGSNIENIGFDDDGEGINEDTPFIVVEEMPRFDGNLNKWLGKNLIYPRIAAENGVEGKVYVEFIVERDGSISNVQVLRSDNSDLSNEAIRAVKAMPRWIPGKQRQTPVRVKFTMPVVFKLQ